MVMARALSSLLSLIINVTSLLRSNCPTFHDQLSTVSRVQNQFVVQEIGQYNYLAVRLDSGLQTIRRRVLLPKRDR